MTKPMVIQLITGVLIGGGVGALMGYFGKCSTGSCPLTASPWRGACYGIVIGALFAFTIPSRKTAETQLSNTSPTESHVRIINGPADFENTVLEAELPVLVDFYSDACPPCRILGPTVEELAVSYEERAIICKVDVSRLSQLARRYGISGIPAVLFFQAGNEKTRLVGLRPEREYALVLDEMTNNIQTSDNSPESASGESPNVLGVTKND